MEELLLTNTNISGCLPMEVGFLYKLRVLDVSSNKSAGILADDQKNCPPDKPLQNDDSCDAVLEHSVDCFELFSGNTLE